MQLMQYGMILSEILGIFALKKNFIENYNDI